MKMKAINFLAAMGIPVSALTTQGAGCSGVCGSCTFNCTPGVLAVIILLAKFIYKNVKGKVLAHE